MKRKEMPLIERIITSESDIGIWKITETAQELLSAFPEDADMVSLFNGRGSEELKLERLSVRVLLHCLLPDRMVKIIYDNNGKPFLKGSSGKISITHTKGYSAIMVSATVEPGIDIERRKHRAAGIASRYLSKKELSAYSNGIDDDSATIRWSAKESVYKIFGAPVVDFRKTMEIDTFDVISDSELKMSVMTANEFNAQIVVNFRVFDDFLLTWAEK